jgi:hypothetical protein
MIKSSFPGIETMERAGRVIGKMKFSAGVAEPEARARAAWRVAAGPKIAEHTRAAMLVRNTLVIEVEDLVWQRQLNTLRHFLLRNLAQALGEPLVQDLDFRPMPPRMAPRRAETAQGGTSRAPAGAEDHCVSAAQGHGSIGPRRAAAFQGSDGIADPVLGMLYRESKKKGTA